MKTTIQLYVIKSEIDFAANGQNRHFNLVELYKHYGYELSFHKKTRSTCRAERHLNVEDINKGVVVFTDAVNINAGSSCTIDLYSLLQSYLLNPEKRKQINSILNTSNNE